MSQKYDAVVQLGYRFEDNWQLPHYLVQALSLTADLYKKNTAPRIFLCGKWSIFFDHQGKVPPYTEASEMRKILQNLGIPKKAIISEEYSKETIGNAYFLKTHIVKPLDLHSLLIVCVQFHEKRVRYIFNKVFGPQYFLEYKVVPTPYDPVMEKKQEQIFKKQKAFLSEMRDGDDEYLKGKLYTDPYFSR